jgi:hypothetical protein
MAGSPWRSSRLSSLPLGFLGRLSTNTTPWALEAGQCCCAVGQHLGLGQRLPAFTTMTAVTASTQRGCGRPTTATSLTCVQAVDRLFHLAAGHVLAAGLDHVLLAVDHGDEALRRRWWPGRPVEPAALECGRGALVVVEVAQHQVRAAVHDLADLAGPRRSGVVHHARLHVQHRAPAEPGLRSWSSGPAWWPAARSRSGRRGSTAAPPAGARSARASPPPA